MAPRKPNRIVTGDDDIEMEWQFDALDLRPVERWLAALPGMPLGGITEGTLLTASATPAVRQVDRYLDTEDWRIGRAGFVLRTRRKGRRDEATLKDSRPAGESGFRQRLEVTEPIGPQGIMGLRSEGPVGRRVWALSGKRPLHPVLEVRTRRRAYSLRIEGEEVAEVALDETTIVDNADGRPAHLRRVEVEVVHSWVDALEPVVSDLRQACGLQPAGLSKYEAGLLAMGITIPGPPDLGGTSASPASSVGALAYAVLRRHLGALLAHEPGTRLGEDIEELHDMRVATRRLRAAIDLFADVLPVRIARLRRELGWLASVLGEVRDLDVQIEHLDGLGEWSIAWAKTEGTEDPLIRLRQLLVDRRADARRSLLSALDSVRYQRMLSGLTALAIQGPSRRSTVASMPAVMVVPELVLDRHRSVMKAARRARRSGAAADFHRLRIRAKRLRYSLEFTADLYGRPTERFVRRMARIQDALGAMQDAEVATAQLMATSGQPDSGLPSLTIFAMGSVAERYRIQAVDLLSSMPGKLKPLGGGEWKALADLMARRRDEARAALPPHRRSVRPTPIAGSSVGTFAILSTEEGVAGATVGDLPESSEHDVGDPEPSYRDTTEARSMRGGQERDADVLGGDDR